MFQVMLAVDSMKKITTVTQGVTADSQVFVQGGWQPLSVTKENVHGVYHSQDAMNVDESHFQPRSEIPQLYPVNNLCSLGRSNREEKLSFQSSEKKENGIRGRNMLTPTHVSAANSAVSPRPDRTVKSVNRKRRRRLVRRDARLEFFDVNSNDQRSKRDNIKHVFRHARKSILCKKSAISASLTVAQPGYSIRSLQHSAESKEIKFMAGFRSRLKGRK
mmetsp:Transcript_3355/g.3804  ORF Transcript_3355/g.3804 Transcript_3355/m.3804 type:complete len:218 (+) Transcript_3355:583-1236(+)